MVEGGIKAGVAQCVLGPMSEDLSAEAGLGITDGPIEISGCRLRNQMSLEPHVSPSGAGSECAADHTLCLPNRFHPSIRGTESEYTF